MRKFINAITTAIIFYFTIGGIAFLGGKGYDQELIKILTYPLEIIYHGATEVKNKGLRAFQTDRIVTKVKTRINKLENPLYILHSNPEATSIELIDLKTSERNIVIDISKDIPLTNVNDRPMISLDSSNRLIYCNLNNGNILFKYNFDGKLLGKFHFDFEIHHRSEVFDGRFFCNTRRKFQMPGFNSFIADEGFAEIGIDGAVKNIFWLSEQNDYLNELQNHVSFTSSEFDPFHINDVELVYNTSNVEDTNKLMNGDVLLSARNLNAIIVVRNNSINKILTGSFNLQHDVDVINDSIISISNNNSAGYFVNLTEVHSNVILYNVVTKNETISLDNIGFATETEGQVQYLPSKRIVIENHHSHELIVTLNDSVIFRNGIDYSIDSNYSEFLSWAPAFDHNPLNKSN